MVIEATLERREAQDPPGIGASEGSQPGDSSSVEAAQNAEESRHNIELGRRGGRGGGALSRAARFRGARA